jgi:hypothetical protein
MISSPINVVICFALAVLLWVCCQSTHAQQRKGNKEVLVFSSGFFVGVGETSGNASFNLGGNLYGSYNKSRIEEQCKIGEEEDQAVGSSRC